MATTSGWDLAQVNVGRLLAPIDDPRIEGFVARRDDINALADFASPDAPGASPTSHERHTFTA